MKTFGGAVEFRKTLQRFLSLEFCISILKLNKAPFRHLDISKNAIRLNKNCRGLFKYQCQIFSWGVCNLFLNAVYCCGLAHYPISFNNYSSTAKCFPFFLPNTNQLPSPCHRVWQRSSTSHSRRPLIFFSTSLLFHFFSSSNLLHHVE